MTEEPPIFIICSVVEVMLRIEGKAYVSSVCFDLKLSYSVEVAAKPYSVGYTVPQFQKFDGPRGNTREHVVTSLTL